MKITLNGQEMPFVEGGYRYIFVKPYLRFVEDTLEKANGDKVHIELYDNGVEIRTLIREDEVATIINRDIVVDHVYNKIYILEADTKFIQHPDGSVEVLDK